MLEHPLDAVYVYVVPWSGFPVVPSYPPPPWLLSQGAGRGQAKGLGCGVGFCFVCGV